MALEADPAFHRYVFVESRSANVQALQCLKQEHPDKAGAIEVVQDDANNYVRRFCRDENWRSVRAVVFLDPFATEVEWSTIEAIAATRAIDLWILFPLMAVNRLLANDPAKVWKDRLTALFGTDKWIERFYRTDRLDDLFGSPLDVVRKACDFEEITRFYLERLKAIFAGVALRPRPLINSAGSPLFQFFFAAGNLKGAPIAVRIAEHLLKRI
jgi:three-Cys-motif partner protein